MQPAARRGLAAAALLAATAVTACGQSAETDPTAGSVVTDQGNDPNRLEVRSSLDERAFVPAQLVAGQGKAFTVRFSNDAKEPHSWVLVPKGGEQAALSAGAGPDPSPTLIKPVVPGKASATPVPTDTVVADTGGPVETDSARVVEVSKLPAGDYTYLCTVPGHAEQGMRGTLTVR